MKKNLQPLKCNALSRVSKTLIKLLCSALDIHFKKDEVTMEKIQIEAQADSALEIVGNDAGLDESELFYIKYDQAELIDT